MHCAQWAVRAVVWPPTYCVHYALSVHTPPVHWMNWIELFSFKLFNYRNDGTLWVIVVSYLFSFHTRHAFYLSPPISPRLIHRGHCMIIVHVHLQIFVSWSQTNKISLHFGEFRCENENTFVSQSCLVWCQRTTSIEDNVRYNYFIYMFAIWNCLLHISFERWRRQMPFCAQLDKIRYTTSV